VIDRPSSETVVALGPLFLTRPNTNTDAKLSLTLIGVISARRKIFGSQLGITTCEEAQHETSAALLGLSPVDE
jgi:hypothetical protein